MVVLLVIRANEYRHCEQSEAIQFVDVKTWIATARKKTRTSQ
jgi:hypothetical protein